MFVSLPILLTSHKQIFFMFPSSYSPHLSQTDIFLCSQDIILPQYLTNGRIMYARFQPALSHALFLSISLYLLSHSPHTSPSPVFLPDFSFIASQPCSTFIFAFSHLHLSISSLSLSAHFPLSCLLARLFLHSLPPLFHFHICIFTSLSPYIFSLTPRTPPLPCLLSLYIPA